MGEADTGTTPLNLPYENPEEYRKDYEEAKAEWACHYTDGCRHTFVQSNHIDRLGYRTEFQRDRDDVIYSASFRQLAHKRQMYSSPGTSSFYNRLTHTLIVSQIARSLAKGLKLDEHLTEAIALGHDLGHSPYGHSGEDGINDYVNSILFPKVYEEKNDEVSDMVIAEKYKLEFGLQQPQMFDDTGKIAFSLEDLQELFHCRPEIDSNVFTHNNQGFRIVNYLERNKGGMNLTRYTTYGIIQASGKARDDQGFRLPVVGIDSDFASFEGQVVRLADDIAWANHDLTEDIVSTGKDPRQMLIDYKDELQIESKHGIAVSEVREFLMADRGERYGAFITDIIESNKGKLTTKGFLPSKETEEGYHIHLSSPKDKILGAMKDLVVRSVHGSDKGRTNARDCRRKIFEICEHLNNPGEFGTTINEVWYSPNTHGSMSPLERLRVVIDYVAYLSDYQADELHHKEIGSTSAPDVPDTFPYD